MKKEIIKILVGVGMVLFGAYWLFTPLGIFFSAIPLMVGMMLLSEDVKTSQSKTKVKTKSK